MIPILYESNEKDFVTQGLGALADTISCTVTEERNGIYELEMEYPLTGAHYSDIVAGNIIFAIPSPYRDAQPFRIYKVTKPLGENVTVYANHISYDLNKIPVKPFTASSAADAMAALKNNCVISNDFEFATDKSTSATMNIETPLTARSCLGGVDGSVLDTYGGEYLWDRFTVNLKNARGTDSGVVIRYGKNLTGLTQEGDVSSLVTGIMPYWYSDGTLVTSDPQIVYAEGATGQTAIPVDMTSNFESQPTAAQLKSAAESNIKSNGIGTPDVSLTTEFLNLSQMSGYENLTLTEKCDLCDTVTIQYEAAGINTKAKIVSITTDVLLERYNSIEVGSVRANIAQTIATQQTQIDNVPTTSDLQRAVEVATNWITGGRGGYVVFHKNADGQPDEILIMNTPDIATATQVWRWNKGGLGYSSTGYNGSYSTAITQDGKIVADFVTTGTMKANIIKGGTLTLGGSGNTNGVCSVVNSSGREVVRLDQSGASIRGGSVQIEDDDSGYTVFSFYTTNDYSGIVNQQVYNLITGTGFRARYNGSLGIVETMVNGGGISMHRYSGGTIREPDYSSGNSPFSVSIYSNSEAQLAMSGTISLTGKLIVSGTKNRVVTTETHGKRLMNAYETATPYFGDIGTATIGERGTVQVDIDPIFAETVTLTDYVVFLQAEGAGEAYISKKTDTFFEISGTAGLAVAYEIKAKQKGYEDVRMEEYDEIVLPDRG